MRAGDVLHVCLERELRLRRPVPAVGAGDGDVGVGDGAVVPLVGAVVRREPAQAAHGLHRVAVRAVCAGVRDHLHVLRDEVALGVDTGPERDRLRVSRAAGPELLLAGQLQPDRAPRRDREVGDDVLDQHLLLGAEPTADARLDDPDVLDLQPHQRSQHPAGVERHLGRRAHDQPLVGVEPRDRDVRFDRHLLDLVDPERSLEHAIRGRERSVDVATMSAEPVDDVAIAIEDPFRVGFVVDHGGARLDRRELVEHRRQDLVLDLDQADRFLGGLDRLGRDDGDPVAHVTHLVVEADLVVRMRVGPRLATGRVLHPGGVPVVEDLVHTRHRSRRPVVDVEDAGVGVGAVQQLGEQHPPQLDVVGERRIALGQLHCVDLDLRLAHHRHLRHVHRRHDSWYGRRERRGRVVGVHLDRIRAVGHRRQHDGHEGIDRVAPQHRGGAADGFDRLDVPGLAIEDARQHVADGFVGRVGIAFEQRHRAEHHRPGRVTGLERTRRHERGLDRVQLGADVQRLDGGHGVAVGLHRVHHVGGHEPSVDEHGSRPGLTRRRPELDAHHPGSSQHGPKGLVRAHLDRHGCAVQLDDDAGHARSSSTRAVSTSTRWRR